MMNIRYQLIITFLSKNKNTFLASLVICLLGGASYFVLTPKVYEAYFQVRTAKILVNKDWAALKWGRYTRRDLNGPRTYPTELVQLCTGSDSNASRKNLVNSIYIDVIDDSGGVVGVVVRLAGPKEARICAEALAKFVVEVSDVALSKRLADEGFSTPKTSGGGVLNFERPMITSQVQMSDSHIKPRLFQTIIWSLLAGFGLAISLGILKERYRA